MSKNRIVLFCVLGVAVGLALGVFGRDFIVANEGQKIEAQKAEEEAKIQAMMTGIPVDASKEFIAAKTLVDDMKSLKAVLLIFCIEHIEQEVDLKKNRGHGRGRGRRRRRRHYGNTARPTFTTIYSA